MRLRSVTLAVLGVVALVLAGTAAAADEDVSSAYLADLYEGNLVPNSDFELASESNPNWPADWDATFSLIDFNRPAWDCTVAYSGNCSLRMSAPLEVEAAWVSPMIPVKPNTEYRFTGYVRTQGLTPEKARFYGTFVIELFSDRGPLFPRPFAAGPNFEGDNDWTEVSFTFKTNARAEQLQISAVVGWGGRAKGHVWFDAIQLEEVVTE
jgi:hypothetical protein